MGILGGTSKPSQAILSSTFTSSVHYQSNMYMRASCNGVNFEPTIVQATLPIINDQYMYCKVLREEDI